jgi:hypothetical protein
MVSAGELPAPSATVIKLYLFKTSVHSLEYIHVNEGPFIKS